MVSNLASRKFIYAITVIIMAFVLVIMEKVEPTAFLNFAELIGGIYVVGNLGAKLFK